LEIYAAPKWHGASHHFCLFYKDAQEVASFILGDAKNDA
jgi:hypothetical protein